MDANIPPGLALFFIAIALIAVGWFYLAANRSRAFLLVIIAWIILQTWLGLQGVYQDTSAWPPRLMLLGMLPALLMIALLFLSRQGRLFIDRLRQPTLTYFHSIRILVEIWLALLYHQSLVPVFMTIEGTNFDLFSGLTAPLVGFWAFRGTSVHTRLLLIWNIVCLLLLLNVVVTAALAIPSPMQKIALEQPNVAVLYFPFNLLPTVIVPLVLLAHLSAIRQLTRQTQEAALTGK